MNLLFTNLKKLDSSIVRVCVNGIKYCFLLTLLSVLLLSVYLTLPSLGLFYVGMSLFKSSLFFMVFFIICAIAIDTIKKEVNQ